MRALDRTEFDRIAGGDATDLPGVVVTANVSSSFVGSGFSRWGGVTGTAPRGTFPLQHQYATIDQGDQESDWTADGDIVVDPSRGVGVEINVSSDDNNASLDIMIDYNPSHDTMGYYITGTYDGYDVNFSHDFKGNEYSAGYTLPNGVHFSIGQDMVNGHPVVTIKGSVPGF